MNINDIICGEAAQVLTGFPSESIDAVVTDPPYLCRYRERRGRRIMNDDNAKAVLSVFDESYRVLKPDSYCISFYGWSAVANFTAHWQALGFRTVGHIVWPKQYASKTGYAHYRHESAFVLAKGNPQRPANPISDVQPWEYTGNRAHPTEKAVSVMVPLITAFSEPGDIILDPFAGSGSTTVAAAFNGRRYIGIELESRYCEITRRRLEDVERRYGF